MAITVNTTPDSVSRRGEGSQREYRVAYKATATSGPAADTEAEVTAAAIAATGFTIGDPWTSDDGAYCSTIESRLVNRRSGPKYEWTTEFTFRVPDRDGKPTDERDPTKRALQVQVVTRRFKEPTLKAAGGAPILNSAGDPVIREKDRSSILFRFTRTLATWDWDWFYESPAGIMFATNLTPWSPAGPWTSLLGPAVVPALGARVEDGSARISGEAGGVVEVSLDISIGPSTEKFIDRGFFFLNEPGVRSPNDPDGPPVAARRRFVDRNGFAAQPQLLDGNGRPLPDGQNPVELEYNLYYPRVFTDQPFASFFA
jgi:hypothetical protein